MTEGVELDVVYQAIAHHTRREILLLLQDGPKPVMEIADHFPISQPAVSQQLGVLLRASLVQAETNGRQRFYRLNPGPLLEVQKWVTRAVTDPAGHVWVFRKKSPEQKGV